MIRVACAIIFDNGRVLAVKRSATMPLPNQWEFPGGKVNPNELDEACITREILEELQLYIQPIKKLTPVVHHYPGKTIALIPIVCTIIQGEPVLVEHSELRWLAADELGEVVWCEADVEVVREVRGNFVG